MAIRRPTPALVALALLLAGCGTTVPRSEWAGVPAGNQDPLGGGGLSVPTTPAGEPSGPAGPGGGPDAVPTIAPPGGGPGPGLDPAAPAPGITSTTIYIGAGYTKNQGAANAALGSSADQGDYRNYYNVMKKRINDAGGILGRKIEFVYYGVDPTRDRTTMDQEACEKYTRDNKVFLMVVTGDILNECARKAGALQFGGGGATKETFEQNPQRVDIEGMELARLGRTTVDGVRRLGYFTPGARIGLVTWDDPNFRRGLDEGYIARLRELGLTPAIEPVYLTTPDTAQGLGQASAQASNAILRFADAGITHVFLLDGPAGLCLGGCITLEWLNAAESQRFRPRYGFNDLNAAVSFYEDGEVPKNQVRGAISLKYLAYDDGEVTNPSRKLCYDIMAKAGYASEDSNAQVAMSDACGTVWFFEKIMNRIQGPISLAGAIDVVNAMGYDFQSPLSYFNFFGPGRHDGTAGVRLEQYQDGCDCFEFATGPYRV